MASVRLRFLPPQGQGWSQLKIFEAPTKTGSFQPIETVADIGTYPDYIDHHTTNDAASVTDWFTIQWVDADGALSDMSQAMQGGTESLVGEITQRMLQRDPTLDEIIAAQEAEVVISEYFNVIDPYSVDPETISPVVKEGLTLLGLALGMVVTTSTSSTSGKFTAGLVSLDSGSSTSTTKSNADDLIKLANRLLKRNYSIILQMAEIPVAGGRYTSLLTADLSRTMVEI